MPRNFPAVALVVLLSIFGAVNGQVENPCEKGIDLGVIVDRSKSVGRDNFITVKNALKTFVDNFNITKESTHVSFIFFSGFAYHLFNLTDPQYHSNEAVKGKIDSLPDRLYSGTRTDLALMKAHDHMFDKGQDRQKRPNVLVVFTDGETADVSAPYSETVPPLEDKGVNIIAVGIGRAIKKEELEKIAGDRGSVVQVPDFDALAGKLNEILVEVCIINGGYTHWSEWSECTATCGEGTRTRSRNCTNPEPMGGGKNCDDIGPPQEQEACDLPECDKSIDGGYTRWTKWTQCSQTCGGGVQIRFRTCTNPPPYLDGKNCDVIGKPQETIKCNEEKCVKEPAPCDQGLDLGILIDQSQSITKKHLERLLKEFMPPFFKKMKIAKKKTHIGIITYHRNANLLALFNGKNSRSYRKAKAFVESIDPKPTLLTRTDRGLEAAYKQLFVKKNGDRPSKQNVLLTFSDGRAYPAKHIKPFSETVPPLTGKKSCHMVAIGYGVPSKLNMTQLEEIAGDNVIKVSKPRRIKKLVKKIKKMVCSVDGGYNQWSMWTICSATCGVGVKMRSRVCNSPPPRKGGKSCSRLGKPYETAECNEGECPKGPTPCDGKKMDVSMIVDASLSVKLPNYIRVKTFLTQFIHQFEPNTHFSIMTFAKHPTVHCKFSDNKCQTSDDTHVLIENIPDKLSWGTYTDRALVEADKTVFTPENGDRADAPNVAMIITDGKTMKGSAPYNVTVPPLRDGKKVKVLAFGVGPSIREEDLNVMAGEKNWFYVEDFIDMRERIPDILGHACNETVSSPLP